MLVGLDGVHVIAVERDDANGALTVTVESAPRLEGCPRCGVVAVSLGRPVVELIDAPMAGRPVRIRWRKRSWRCPGSRLVLHPKVLFTVTDTAPVPHPP
ncbi:hypothetical protein [Georgenia halophila]|uniref:hypothetical protein n=1 Tax=Georgenia halophila TaxID=620889 RepID=UPI0031EF8DF6